MICRICKQDLSENNFYLRKDNNTRRTECKKCLKKPSTQHTRKLANERYKRKIGGAYQRNKFIYEDKYCLECKNMLEKTGSVAYKHRKFCSNECKIKHNKNKLETLCIICNKPFIKQWHGHRKQTCSDVCKRQLQSSRGTGKRKTGTDVPCKICNKIVYKPRLQLRKNNFCSWECANIFQARNKIALKCKICGIEYRISKSHHEKDSKRKYENNYCSMSCRNKDTEVLKSNSAKAQLVNFKKFGPNKLELKGREILSNLGYEIDRDYEEQIVLFNKFTVDVFFKSLKFIIQWDGVYWHTKPRRILLDRSQDKYFQKAGIEVLRITDEQIKEDCENVSKIIRERIEAITKRNSTEV